jgi:hypothetical protein
LKILTIAIALPISVALLWSCGNAREQREAVSEVPSVATADCARQRGEYRQVCIDQRYMCVLPFSDAGKVCKDSTECQGECRIDVVTVCDEAGNCKEPALPKPGQAATGMCQADNDPCGSVIPIKNGIAQKGENRD